VLFEPLSKRIQITAIHELKCGLALPPALLASTEKAKIEDGEFREIRLITAANYCSDYVDAAAALSLEFAALYG